MDPFDAADEKLFEAQPECPDRVLGRRMKGELAGVVICTPASESQAVSVASSKLPISEYSSKRIRHIIQLERVF
jgi:hypothetical protein